MNTPTYFLQQLDEQGYCVLENFLAEEHFESLAIKAHQLFHEGLYRYARVGQARESIHHDLIRKDKILWLDEIETCVAQKAYITAIKELAQCLNEAFYLGLYDFEAHFAIYQPGEFYKKHVDQFHNKKDRQISCVYYLNRKWREENHGNLILYNQHNEIVEDVLPTPNRLVCFRSDLPHEVMATNKERHSITGWLKTRPINNHNQRILF